jgi:hypothetical protein
VQYRVRADCWVRALGRRHDQSRRQWRIGNLGRKITNLLLERISARDLTLVTRTPARLADQQARGVAVHAGDYNDPGALEKAYAGKDALMLISGLDVTNRVPEHRNAINAAKQAGIKHTYTSVAAFIRGTRRCRRPTISRRRPTSALRPAIHDPGTQPTPRSFRPWLHNRCPRPRAQVPGRAGWHRCPADIARARTAC